MMKDEVRDAGRPCDLRVPESHSGFAKVAFKDARGPLLRHIRTQNLREFPRLSPRFAKGLSLGE